MKADRAKESKMRTYSQRFLRRGAARNVVVLLTSFLTFGCAEMPTVVTAPPLQRKNDCQMMSSRSTDGPMRELNVQSLEPSGLAPRNDVYDPYACSPPYDWDVDWGTFTDGSLEWGNTYNDGHGFVWWGGEYPLGEDNLDLAISYSMACPVCAVEQIAEQIVENPAVVSEAVAIGESAAGLAMRLAQVARAVGPRMQGQWHHIATNKNWIAGQQWSRQFSDLFGRAGLSLNDALNKVYVVGHRGPHPQSYHQEIYDRLSAAFNFGGRENMIRVLRDIAIELQDEGSNLYQKIVSMF